MNKMETKHTPGPWTVRDHGGFIEVETRDETLVHFGELSLGGPDHDLALANARLIAAAADMLAELIAKEAWIVDYIPEGTTGRAAELASVRAAIAKAEGR